jgi:hypothetical protein
MRLADSIESAPRGSVHSKACLMIAQLAYPYRMGDD